MSIFQDVEISWNGENYKVEHTKVMRLIAVIEDHVRIGDLVNEAGPKLSKLAMAYAAALRFAGARVGDEEVYETFFDGGKGPEKALELSSGLLMLMMPPASLKQNGDAKKKP